MPEELAQDDARVGSIASLQHGVVTIRQLLEAGLSDDQVLERRRSGRLHRLYRGVYAVGHTAPNDRMRWMAAVLAASFGRAGRGRGGVSVEVDSRPPVQDAGGTSIPGLHPAHAFLSHRSAAALWRILPERGQAVDISVPTRGGRARRSGIRIHRSTTLTPGDTTWRHRIPVTTPTRTLADLKGSVSAGERRRAIRQAEFLGLNLGQEIETDGTRSELERLFLSLCERHGLPAPEVNMPIGPLTVDFCWPKQRLVVETDGYRFHAGRQAFEDDRSRDLELRRRGYDVVRLSYRQVADEPERIATVLSSAWATYSGHARGTRPGGQRP